MSGARPLRRQESDPARGLHQGWDNPYTQKKAHDSDLVSSLHSIKETKHEDDSYSSALVRFWDASGQRLPTTRAMGQENHNLDDLDAMQAIRN